jgi:ADP-heptose:LPS heptosyltransferase
MPSCLVIKNDGIGDLVLASGIIAELGKIFDGNVDLVTCDSNEEIAKHLYGVRKIIYVSRDDLTYQNHFANLGYSLPIITGSDRSAISYLKSVNYDYAICLRRFIRPSAFVLMQNINAKNKHCAWQFPNNISRITAINISKKWNHFFGDVTIFSEGDYYKSFLESIFNCNIDARPRLKNTDKAESRPKEKVVGLGLGFGPNHWPIGNWAELIESLLSSGWQVLLFGGKDGEKAIQILKDQFPNCENLVGQLTFEDSLPYFSKLSAYIGTDTGFTHIASLMVPKCLVILGGGTFRRFFPWSGAKNQYAIYHGLQCFDCDWKCEYYQRHCISFLSSKKVFNYFSDITNANTDEHLLNTNPNSDTYQIAWKHLPVKITTSFPNKEDQTDPSNHVFSWKFYNLKRFFEIPNPPAPMHFQKTKRIARRIANFNLMGKFAHHTYNFLVRIGVRKLYRRIKYGKESTY